MNGWKYNVMTQTIMANRNGWKGAWDAIKAAATGKIQLTVPTPVTLSFWVKTDNPDAKIEYSMSQVQAETGEGWDG